MHSSTSSMLRGAAGLQGSRTRLLTHYGHSQNAVLRSNVCPAHRKQRRHAAAAGWPCQVTARVETSVEYDSPQTSDDEAVLPGESNGHGNGAAALHAAHSSRHARDSHAAAPSHEGVDQGDASTSHPQADVQHHQQQQDHQQQQQHHQQQRQQDGASGAALQPSQSAASESSVHPSQLFPSRHVPRWSPLLVAYFPVGCVVGVLRMATWVVLLAVDSALLTNNDTMIQVLYKLLGLRVHWRGTQHLPAERHVLVSNHVSVGDLMVLYARPRSYVHLITSRLPKRITQARNHRVKLRHASGETYCRLADEGADADPIHLFPEGGMTNGRGMMRFSRGFMRFGKGLPIVPAAVRAAPAFGISTHTLGSSFGANMFWFCFAPWVDLEVTALPPMRPEEGEGNGHFVERVQRAIAEELDIPVADITLQQKHKLNKR